MIEKKNANPQAKFTIGFIEKVLARESYTADFTNYKNSHSLLPMKCKRGHDVTPMPFTDFYAKKRRCAKCTKIERDENKLAEIRKTVEGAGYQLKPQRYQGAKTKLEFQCAGCGTNLMRNWDVMLRNIRAGHKCKHCMGRTDWSIPLIKKLLADEGYQLISTKYENSYSKLESICPEGHPYHFNMDGWVQGHRCPIDAGIKVDWEDVKATFARNGNRLLTERWPGKEGKLEYICDCGKTHAAVWGSYKNGARCPACGKEKNVQNQRHKIDSVKAFFADHNCELLEEKYENEHVPMAYMCECGRIHKTSFLNFKNGRRCGCIVSLGAKHVEHALNGLGVVKYKKEFRIKECRNIKPLPFDFALFENGKFIGLIEFDGIQHREPRKLFGGQAAFQILKKHDKIKTDYCRKNGIPLLRIQDEKRGPISKSVTNYIRKLTV